MSDLNITVDVKGLTETIVMLGKAPQIVMARGLVKALQAGANVIADVLESNTPIKAEDTGGILERGELRELLMIQTQIDPSLYGGSATIGFGDRGGRVADWLEYGHRILPHNPPKPRNSKEYLDAVQGFVEPNPFMRASFDASYQAAVEAFTASLAETIAQNFDQSIAA